MTGGVLLIIQIVLAAATSSARGKNNVSIGDGGNDSVLRALRRHGNFAENAGIFLAGFTILELSRLNNLALIALCSLFLFFRIVHAIGLSKPDTRNGFRLVGGLGTYLAGLVVGALMIWAGTTAAWPLWIAK
jgi:uncharacterized membrane protein YecN with MAPEG domain